LILKTGKEQAENSALVQFR